MPAQTDLDWSVDVEAIGGCSDLQLVFQCVSSCRPYGPALAHAFKSLERHLRSCGHRNSPMMAMWFALQTGINQLVHLLPVASAPLANVPQLGNMTDSTSTVGKKHQ